MAPTPTGTEYPTEFDDLWPQYDGPGPGSYGAAAPTYPVYTYRVAPSAKIIHLTPRQ